MLNQQRKQRRRRGSSCPLTRALGAACFAGATALSRAFVTSGANGSELYGFRTSRAAARVRVSLDERQPRFALPPALAEPLPLLSLPSSKEKTKRSPQKPPLTVEEERKLLMKVEEAKALRRLQKNLAMAEKGGLVTPEVWAREAGLEVDELRHILLRGLDAKQALVERNLPMVMRLIEEQYRWRLRGSYVSTADLLQEGAYALGLAADRFDVSMANRFMTFAMFLVRDKLDTAVASGTMAISVPATALKELYRARRDLTAKVGREPTEAEMASFFVNGMVMLEGVPIFAGGHMENVEVQPRIRRRRLELLTAVQKVSSLDTLIRDGTGNTIPLVDTLADSSVSPLRMPGNSGISELIPKVLTRREADLVRMACGLGKGRPLSFAECAQKLSLSVAKTKAMFEISLDKLKTAATVENPMLLTK